MRRIALAVLTLGVLSACSNTGGNSNPITREAVESELATAICARLFSGDCCGSTELARWTDEAACVAELTLAIQNDLGEDIDGAVAAGWGTYSSARAEECRDEFAEVACDELILLYDTKCDKTFDGNKADGELCADPEECVSRNCSSGTCQPMPGEGDACEDACPYGLFCETDGSGTCKPVVATGACVQDEGCASDSCDTLAGTCEVVSACEIDP